jgi:hypothetical protein
MEKINYIVEETYIYYDTETSRVSFPKDPANSDYQAYLNKDKAEQSTPSVIDEA